MTTPEVRFCTTADDVTLAYYTSGTGVPIVFLSVPYSHLLVEQRVESGLVGVASVANLVRFDPRGFGMSQRHVEDLSLDAMVRDLEALVDHLELSRFVLVASGGAPPIALQYAASHPDRLLSMVLVGGNPGAPRLLIERMTAMASVKGADWRFICEGISRMRFGWDDEETSRNQATLLMESIDLEGLRAFLPQWAEWDARQVLHKVTTRTLVTAIKDHPWFGPEPATPVLTALPDARLALVDGRTFAERDEQNSAAIRRFLDPSSRSSIPAGSDHDERTLRTVLFTDLVGHTEMMQRLGDERGRAVLREHERITRDVLKEHGGAEVKTMGDGFMASFASVTKAMECAIALQRAFAAHTASMPEPLYVRVGLNAGEPIAEDGDLFGSTVILAARVAAQAGPGEILIPEPVRHLLTGKDFLFADRGEVTLKGFENAYGLFEVKWQE